jgi:hypothetical protein
MQPNGIPGYLSARVHAGNRLHASAKGAAGYLLSAVGLVLSLAVPVQATESPFAEALIAQGPSPEIPSASVGVFDWLIGDWEAEVYDYGPEGRAYTGQGEWHFSWVLEGRAIQDVWIVPKRSQRRGKTPLTNNRFGTSLRIYDPTIDAWRVLWFNPVTQDRAELIARKVGSAVVQQSADRSASYRWTFDDITPRSFTWRGEVSDDGGRTWRLDAEFRAHRREADKP